MILTLFLLFAQISPPDADTMVNYLENALVRASVYAEPFPDNAMFIVEYEDSTTCVGSFDHFFDIAIRENHTAETGGDPDAAPVLDRFRVYVDGTVLWWSPLPGMYIPWDDFVSGITDL